MPTTLPPPPTAAEYSYQSRHSEVTFRRPAAKPDAPITPADFAEPRKSDAILHDPTPITESDYRHLATQIAPQPEIPTVAPAPEFRKDHTQTLSAEAFESKLKRVIEFAKAHADEIPLPRNWFPNLDISELPEGRRYAR